MLYKLPSNTLIEIGAIDVCRVPPITKLAALYNGARTYNIAPLAYRRVCQSRRLVGNAV